MSRALEKFNERALRAMGVPSPGTAAADAGGVIIGFVDYGFDLLHPALIDGSGATRFKSVWDQNSGELDEHAINAMIRAARNAGSRLAADQAYDPHANHYGRRGVVDSAHGTLMASIAAGRRYAGFRGAAASADLIGVHLALPDHGWREEDVAGTPSWTSWSPTAEPVWNGWKSYSDAPQIVAALHYIHARAARLRAPGVVINLSIGTWAGAHDGRSAVERTIADLSRPDADPPCAVVIGAGNAGRDDGHFEALLEADEPASFAWSMGADDPTQNKLEIWYEADRALEIDLVSPGQSAAPLRLTPGPTHRILSHDRAVGIADHQPRVRGRLGCARLLLHPLFFPGALRQRGDDRIAWDVRLRARRSGAPASVHAWIERDDGFIERSTLNPSTPLGTLCSLACADGAIVVASYDSSGEGCSIFPPSSLGPPAWGGGSDRPAPHIAAPGHRIWGAHSKTNGFAPTSGTSASAALVSGALALVMASALRADRTISGPMLRDALISGSWATAADHRSWDPRFGFGPVRIADLIRERSREQRRAS